MPSSLSDLAHQLASARSPEDKRTILHQTPAVLAFLASDSWLVECVHTRSIDDALIILSIVAAGQLEVVFPRNPPGDMQEHVECVLQALRPVERFYAAVGGIVGYQACVLKALNPPPFPEEQYHIPTSIDASEEGAPLKEKIISGISSVPKMAEVCPVGGAADRLGLYDVKKGHFLPAARLVFLGKTLLERIVIDAQAREYLYYKLHGAQYITPFILMTSQEKDNHEHILAICKENRWFFRPQESFVLVSQPSVPLVDRLGRWCMQDATTIQMKPGGHGAIWKLIKDLGIFTALRAQGREKLLVRQINNPIAGTDYGLLAFLGEGFLQNKDFGFLSCPRQEGLAEGVNVLIQDGAGYRLTNIEYCDTRVSGCIASLPANTNILFADVTAIDAAVDRMPFPGTILNFRGESARLESMMQNIADSFVNKTSYKNTFLMQARRSKTISTTKRISAPGEVALESPERCFMDFMHNARELLQKHCGYSVEEDPVFFTYHPALGPLYSVIASKLRGGFVAKGSELHLHIAELDIENLHLVGSLCVHADYVMGHVDEKGILQYSEHVGRCSLKNVRIENQGADLAAWQSLWQREPERKECCQIVLKGMSAFYAENIVLRGNIHIEVEDGEQVIASSIHGTLHLRREPIASPSWHWRYAIQQHHDIAVEKVAP